MYIHTVDGQMFEALTHRATPLTPNLNVIFLFTSFLRVDELNQTPGIGDCLQLKDAGFG